VLITARNTTLGVVPTCVGPRPRDYGVGEKGTPLWPYLQLLSDKQQRPISPALLRLAHPCHPHKGKSHGYHPTQKRLRLLRRAILASTHEGDLVFDPFCGSGSSGVASKELGRFFVGAEKEEEYAQLAGRRIGAALRGELLREIRGEEG
jgi:DNA modification methylase